MQVILQEKIKNLGSIGEIVDVKPGYARNYLFRSGKALPATKDNVARVMEKKSELEKVELSKLKDAQKRAELIEKLVTVDLAVPTNEEGKLFGSVGSSEVVDLLLSNGQEVTKQEVSILESPIREVGKYTIVVQAHPDVAAHLHLNLTSSTVADLEVSKSSTTDNQSQSLDGEGEDVADSESNESSNAPVETSPKTDVSE